jgi:uncharacterized membrane protein YgcG
LVRDRSGQSTTIGVVLLLALTVTGTGLVVSLGSQAIQDTQQSADLSRAEHSMTLLDSRTAVVALGETGTQSIQFRGTGDGSLTVHDDRGWIRVRHYNYTGNGDNETIYNGSLGATTYENGRTTIAYQGGGVWRERDGASTMVSPPEFHYRSGTLTLPVIQVEGDDSAGARSEALISMQESTRVYPNETTATASGEGAPYDADDAPYDNPLRNGTVKVTVQSQYYQGWATYFRQRTEGNVTVDDEARRTTVELETTSTVGAFELPPRNKALRATSMAEDHAINDFSVNISEGNNFNNMYFSFWAESGGKELEMLVHVPGGLGGNPCKDGDIDEISNLEMDVYYHDEATSEGHHAWTNDSIDADTGPVRLECASGGGGGGGGGPPGGGGGPPGGGGGSSVRLIVDFTSGQELTYGSFTTSNDGSYWHHDWDGSTESDVEFDQHSADPSGDFTSGDTATLDLLVNHYFALFAPDMDLVVSYGPGNSPRVDPSASTGSLDYDAGDSGRYITFLHVTENRVRVQFR